MEENIIISTDGLVIKEFSLNEKDKLLTVLTSEFGKKTVLVRGVKNIKSKRAGGASLFSYSTFEFEQKGGKEILSDVIPKAHFPDIPTDLEGLALASYIADTLTECSTENCGDDGLLRLALNCLYAIDKKLKPFPFIKAAFEFKAACLLGFAPDTDNCHLCGKSFDAVPAYAFSTNDGCFCHKECFENLDETVLNGYMVLSRAVKDAAVFLKNSDSKKILSFSIDEKASLDFEEFCEKYLISKLERKPRTLDYYKKMRNK